MSAHTPGPWSVGYAPTNNYTAHVGGFSARGKHIVLARLPKPSRGTVDANARLMAAAPELLDALLCLRCELRDYFGPPSDGAATYPKYFDGAMTRASAAIAKATQP